MPRVFAYSQHNRVFIDSYHTMHCQSMTKSIIYGLHPMIILQKKFICFQTKSFLDVTPQLSFIYKTHVSFVGSKFPGSHRRLRTHSNTFWTFTVGVSELVRVFHPRKNLALLAITPHVFLTISYNLATLLDFVQQY